MNEMSSARAACPRSLGPKRDAFKAIYAKRSRIDATGKKIGPPRWRPNFFCPGRAAPVPGTFSLRLNCRWRDFRHRNRAA